MRMTSRMKKKNENIADKPDRDTGNGTAACGEFASYIPLSLGGGGICRFPALAPDKIECG